MKPYSDLSHMIQQFYEKLGIEADQKIINEICKFHQTYYSLTANSNVIYEDPIAQFAYFFRYVPFRYLCINSAIEHCEPLKLKIAQGDKKIISLGGGPGTEILAISRFAGDKRNHFQLMDACNTWKGFIESLEIILNSKINFIFDDIWNHRLLNYYSLRKFDIFTMSFLLSELYASEPNEAVAVLNSISGWFPKDSYFIFLDFHSPKFPFSEILTKLAEDQNLEVVYKKIGETTFSKDATQSIAGGLWQKFPDGDKTYINGSQIYWQPQRKGKIICMVLKKK